MISVPDRIVFVRVEEGPRVRPGSVECEMTATELHHVTDGVQDAKRPPSYAARVGGARSATVSEGA